jgi:hypothetical protein
MMATDKKTTAKRPLRKTQRAADPGAVAREAHARLRRTDADILREWRVERGLLEGLHRKQQKHRVTPEDAETLRRELPGTALQSLLQQEDFLRWLEGGTPLGVELYERIRRVCERMRPFEEQIAIERACGGDAKRIDSLTVSMAKRDKEGADIRPLLGFDPVRASRLLSELAILETATGKADRSRAALAAAVTLLGVLSLSGPERLSEQRYVKAIRQARDALAELIPVAKERESLEQRNEDRTIGSRSHPRPVQVTRSALRLAQSLARRLRWLDRAWSFSSVDRTLPGTADEHRSPSTRQLAELESKLGDGGFSHAEIALLDLGGHLQAIARENASRDTAAHLQIARKRVKDRLAMWRKFCAKAEADMAAAFPLTTADVASLMEQRKRRTAGRGAKKGSRPLSPLPEGLSTQQDGLREQAIAASSSRASRSRRR